MQVIVIGAGSVGRSISRELVTNDHQLTIIDNQPSAMRIAQVPEAKWLLGDGCELDTLKEGGVETCEVMVAATGDDKANLVVSLIAKTEFGVPRTVARVNNPKNEWMFDESWGVDVAVSTPRIMTAMVEEAVSIGSLVKIFTFNQSQADILELTLPAHSAAIGKQVGNLVWPKGTSLASIVRGQHPISPKPTHTLEVGDQLIIIAGRQAQLKDLERLLVGEPTTK